VIALDARDGLEDVLRVVDGRPEPIESQFKLGYGSVALLLATGADPAVLRRRVEASFGQYQNLKRIRATEGDIERLERALAEARAFAAPCGDFERIGRYRRLREEVDARRRASGRGGRRGERGVIDAEPGRLVLVRRRGGPELAVILGIHAIRGHRVLVDALLPHGAVVRVKSGVIKQVFWSAPSLNVPRDRSRDPRRLHHLADELSALDVRELTDRERAQRPEATLGTIECHRCPWSSTPRCDHAWREVERLAEGLAQRRTALEAYRSAYWQEFLRVLDVLEQFEAVRDRALTAKGRLIAGLRHDNELLIAEALTQGVLSDVTLAEAAAVCSALLEEARSREPVIARMFLRKRPKLKRKLDHLELIAERVREAQRARHLGMPAAVHGGYMPAVFRWASGEDDWTGIVQEAFGGYEGDLIRAMRRLIDILHQLAESREVPPATARLLLEAARVIDRGVVLESALI
jgi:superfamily II RNA helicase